MIYIFVHNITFRDLALALKSSLELHDIPCNLTEKIKNGESNLYILYGMHDYVGPLPSKYIVYQLEQSAPDLNTRKWFTTEYLTVLKGALEVWDYSLVNINRMRAWIPKSRYVPLTYTPILKRIRNLPLAEKTIDVLFYGTYSQRRWAIYEKLKACGLSVTFAQDLWKDRLDDCIAKSKIVLNLHYYNDPILETSRLSYLITNEVFVISESSTDPILDKEYSKYLVFAKYDDMVETVKHYLKNYEEGILVASLGHTAFKERQYAADLDWDLLRAWKPDSKETVKTPTQTQTLRYIQAEVQSDGDGQVLKLPEVDPADLPLVTIVTLTYNRSEMAELSMRNFRLFNYPQDKLEWVIVDDSNERHQAKNKEVFGVNKELRDPRINLMSLSEKKPISEKRNLGANEAQGEIILHMDDDDYYTPDSVMARVKLLLKYKDQGIRCVGCTEIGIYNLQENYSYEMTCPYPSEASLGYWRDFWAERPFLPRDVAQGEGIPFLEGRTDAVLNMPYFFNFIALTHAKNITGKLRTIEIDRDQKFTNYFSLWDFNTQMFILSLARKVSSALNKNK